MSNTPEASPAPSAPSAATLWSEAKTAGLLPVVLVGVIAGVTSGLFGVGGGIVIVPSLVMLARFPHKLATGTSLTAIVPISSAAVIGYTIGGEVDWATALCVSIGAIVGAVVGTRLLVRLPTRVLQLGFSVTMIITAVRLLFDDADAGGRGDLTVGMGAAMVTLGLVAGVLAGLLGVGGGIIIVPVLTLLFGVPHVLAKGTSLAVIVPTAIMGTIRNRKTGLTALRPAAVVGTAGIASAFVASRVSLGLDARVSQGLFAGLLVFAAARLLRDGRSTDPADA